MQGKPHVMTSLGPGILYEIRDEYALVEFEYTYLVEIPLKEVDLRGFDPTNSKEGRKRVKEA